RTPRGTILSPTPPLQSTPGPSEWPAARSRPRGWGASAPQPPRRAEENDHAAGNAPGARRYPLCWHGSSGVGARGGREARRPGELERLLQAPSTGSKVKRVVRATSARRPGPRAAGGAGLGRLLRARGLGAGTTQGAGAVAAIEGARALPLPAAGVMPATAAGAGRGAAVGDTHQSEKRGAARGSEERSCRWERAVEGGGEGGQEEVEREEEEEEEEEPPLDHCTQARASARQVWQEGSQATKAARVVLQSLWPSSSRRRHHPLLRRNCNERF
ncbi:unnamed protein product, partial [Prorocentrum cordatum]